MTDQQALQQYVASRDAEAFRILVEQYQRLVYAAASRRLGRQQDIEDVAQTTFFKLAKSAGAVRRDPAAWLYTTTINTANDLVRRDQTRRRHETLAAPAEALVNDPEAEEWRKLSPIIDEVLLELPKAQQSLIVEHFLRGRSQRDLAEQIGVSQPTILRRINAAVQDLRKRLADRGYPIAAPPLASAMVKIPQPAVPAALTGQLVKVGLSVAPISAPAFAAGMWIKIGLAVMALAAVVAAGIELLQPATAPAPSNAGATTQVAVAATNPSDWRAAFTAAFALAPGQNLKYLPPPPLPERQRWLKEVDHDDSPLPFIEWRWVGGRLRRGLMVGAGPDGAGIGSVLLSCAGLDEHHVSLENLPPIDADGDWIVRDGAGTEAILTDLQAILHDHFNVATQFQKTTTTKDAIVVTGTYRLQRIPGTTMGDLQVYADVLDHPKLGDAVQGGGTTSPAGFWQMLGSMVGMPIVDESKHEPRKIDWLLSHSIMGADTDDHRRQEILDNLSKQTGLVFTKGKRDFVVWRISGEP
jgi:RNA polymerase sigma factor (sigma-70 family)